MKKKIMFLLVIVALMAALLPVGVLAGAPAEVKVFVHNKTGADVELSITDADGNVQWMTVVAGVSTQMMTEGKYSYYAVTNCGNQAGMWNLNVAKQLDITCDAGGASVNLSKQCPRNYYGVVWVDKVTGVHLYVEKDNVNIPDSGYFMDALYHSFGHHHVYPIWFRAGEMCWYDFTPGRSTDSWGDGYDSVWYDNYEW